MDPKYDGRTVSRRELGSEASHSEEEEEGNESASSGTEDEDEDEDLDQSVPSDSGRDEQDVEDREEYDEPPPQQSNPANSRQQDILKGKSIARQQVS